MQVDHIDMQILRLLAENSRIQWKDLGKQIHMTGQAVGNRIRKLEEIGVIQAYTVLLDEMKLGLSYTAFVTVYMTTPNHKGFIHFLQDRDEVLEAHRVSGDGCYHLKITVASQEALNHFLDALLDYGNYRLHLSIQEIKKQHGLHPVKQ
ncbi:MAG: Lrp/AsnC family transcriptional regulator [Solibacillus sp.]